MTEKIIQSLEGVSETLLMTLYARARESQRPDAMIHDDQAVDMVSRIAGDFSRFRMQKHDEITIIMRMRKLDSYVREFLARNPDAVVVHIGCGLDTRFERVDNGRLEWFDLDMPDVIELRRKLIRNESTRYHMLADSAFEDGWFKEVSQYKPRSFMFVTEGVLPYFEEAQVKSLFLKLMDRFPGSELACDAHTPFVIWADNVHLALWGRKVRMHWGLKSPRDVEGWGAASPTGGIRLLDQWNYYEDDEPRLGAFRWVFMIPALAKSAGVYHYKLG